MPLGSTQNKDAKGVPASGGRRALTVAVALIAIALSVGAIIWQRRAAMQDSPDAPPTAQDQKALYTSVIEQQRARSAGRMKPTVTAEMGDVGGKYFGQAPDPARVRHYYVAAESEMWDYLPSGSDPVCGLPLPPDIVVRHLIRKTRYIQYTDATFTQRVPQPARLGILGPVLRGVVGDYLVITFTNRAAFATSMHPHGVKYDKDSEGSYHSDFMDQAALVKKDQPGRIPFQGKGAAVAPGACFTYVWYCDEQSGPLPSEPSSKGWIYHSHVANETEINLGMEGFIIVTDPKRARPDGTPNDVDREMGALFLIFDESGLSGEAREGAADRQRFSINGLVFGNLPGLAMNEGEHVRWYLFGLGNEIDLHTAHWHGLRVIEDNRRRTDTVELLPASMKIADMLAENAGDWLFHCHVEEHMMNGMFARVSVRPKGGAEISRAPEQAFFGMASTNVVAK